MIGVAIPAILVLGAIVFVVVIAIQRSSKKSDQQGDGADIVAYLVLAAAMGVAGFALAELVATAFPRESLVFDPVENLATSLSALVVATPFLIYFWRRQALRRVTYPKSAGWTLYLSLIELVFMTAFVVTAVQFINGLISDEAASTWIGTVVFGAIVVFHEIAARQTPPLSDAGELRRVIGSAVGLIAATIGMTGVLIAALSEITGSVLVGDDQRFHPWLAMLVVGAPVWWYRWLRPWDAKPSAPRITWSVIVTVASLATALGSAAYITVMTVEYLLTETPPAGQHFEFVTYVLPFALTGLAAWVAHRRGLGEESDSPVRLYRYAIAALGLVASASAAVALTITVFNRSLIVGGDPGDVVALAVGLVISLVVWLVFERSAAQSETGAISGPRRIYTLGVGVFFGLVSAGSLITTLFILLRRLLDGSQPGSLLEPTTILVYTGLAAWYLLGAYGREREATPAADAIVPFEVTIICSHPGMLAARFPDQARLRVVYRGDGVGHVDDETAGDIVAEVANRSSVVWVDGDGFKVAPLRS